MFSSRLGGLIVVGLAVFLCRSISAFAGDPIPSPHPPPARIPTYTFTPIGTLPGYEQAFVNDINNAGQVVGTAWRIVFGPDPAAEHRAFIFEDGVLNDIGTSEFHSGAEGLSNHGHIVGFDDDAQSSQISFLLDDNAYHELFCCTAVDVNDLGQVIIQAGVSYLWQQGTLTDLGTLGGSIPDTDAEAINNLGQIVGKSRVNIPTPPFGQSRAFLWEDGIMIELPRIGEGWSSAIAINDLGEIIGYSGGGPVIWKNGAVEDLTTAPYMLIGGIASLNNYGFIVGGVDPPGVELQYASVCYEGNTYDLNRLVPPGTSWRLMSALVINDLGDIAGLGRAPEYPYWNRAYFLGMIDADVDDDGYVSLLDYTLSQPCFSGPDTPPSMTCASRDVDSDGDVDFVDYRSLELAFEPQ